MKKARTFRNPEEAREFLRNLGQQMHGSGPARWIGKVLEGWAERVPSASDWPDKPAPAARPTRGKTNYVTRTRSPDIDLSQLRQDPVIQPGDSESGRVLEILLVLAVIGIAIFLLG